MSVFTFDPSDGICWVGVDSFISFNFSGATRPAGVSLFFLDACNVEEVERKVARTSAEREAVGPAAAAADDDDASSVSIAFEAGGGGGADLFSDQQQRH